MFTMQKERGNNPLHARSITTQSNQIKSNQASSFSYLKQ